MKKIVDKIVLILLIFVVVLTVGKIKVAAISDTCKLTIESDKSLIKRGDTVTLSINVSEIESEEGIVLADFLLNYDTDIFKSVEIEETEDKSWVKDEITENYIAMKVESLEGTKENGTICKIILTAGEEIKEGETTISLTTINFTSTDVFSIEDITKKITIENQQADDEQADGEQTNDEQADNEQGNSEQTDDEQADGEQTNDEQANDEQTNDEQTNNTTNKNTLSENNTSPKETIPYVGHKEFTPIGLIVILMIVLVIFAYKKMKEYKEV